MSKGLENLQPILKPADILAGLGGADRNLLATCIALFEESTLTRRLEHWYSKLESLKWNQWRGASSETSDEDFRDVQDTQAKWLSCDLSDDDLRLVLWIHLRGALELPARLSATHRGCALLGDDVTAKLISYLDPPGAIKSGKRWLCEKGWLSPGQPATRLSDIVLPVLDELLESSQVAEDSLVSRENRRERLAEALISLGTLSKKDREVLLNDTGANNANDKTIQNSLLLGGGLSLFGIGVSSAGFSAYILAAQVSAFIPMVTGPGLVSFVSVISNPISIIAATGGGAWWIARSARQKANVSIASRVVAMLVIQGLQTGSSGLDKICASFRRIPGVIGNEMLNDLLTDKQRDAWYVEWQLLRALWGGGPEKPAEKVMHLMETAVKGDFSKQQKRKTSHSDSEKERVNAGVFGVLTVGDILYNSAAIDPEVIKAADFSRVAEIDGYVEFAQVASEILSGSDSAVQGGISQLKGYVAERAVAADLVSSGHTVSFPDASNTSGFDLIVDGQPCQVKFHESLQGIREHFDSYDYPVFANSELAGKIPDDLVDQVFFIEGLSNELITEVAESSLNAADQMLNSSSMASAGAISIARGLIAYQSGSLTHHQLVEQVLLDGMVRVGLAGSGAAIGSAVGLLTFGPAGAWVFGTGAPILAAMQTSNATTWIKGLVRSEQLRLWERMAHARIDDLQNAVLRALKNKTELTKSKIAQAPKNWAGDYLRWRFEEDIRYAFECEKRISSFSEISMPTPERRASELLRGIASSSVHPSLYPVEMRAVTRCLGERPGLRELFDRQNIDGFGNRTKDYGDRLTRWFKDKTR